MSEKNVDAIVIRRIFEFGLKSLDNEPFNGIFGVMLGVDERLDNYISFSESDNIINIFFAHRLYARSLRQAFEENLDKLFRDKIKRIEYKDGDIDLTDKLGFIPEAKLVELFNSTTNHFNIEKAKEEILKKLVPGEEELFNLSRKFLVESHSELYKKFESLVKSFYNSILKTIGSGINKLPEMILKETVKVFKMSKYRSYLFK